MSTIRANTGKKVSYGLHNKNSEILYMALTYFPTVIFFYVRDLFGEEHSDDEDAISVDFVESLTERLVRASSCVGDGNKVTQ